MEGNKYLTTFSCAAGDLSQIARELGLEIPADRQPSLVEEIQVSAQVEAERVLDTFIRQTLGRIAEAESWKVCDVPVQRFSIKPILKISYYGHDEPVVELPERLRDTVEVELVDLMENAFLVLRHNNVSVYQTYKDEHAGEVQQWAEFCFSTEMWTDWESDGVFDLRDLPVIPDGQCSIYQNMYPDSEVKQRLAYAIEQGWLTEESCQKPEDTTTEVAEA